MDTPTLIAIDTAALPWEERFNEKLGRALYRKNLITDPDTGMEVRLVRYPAGVINVRHTHPCATACTSWRARWSPMPAGMAPDISSGSPRAR